MTALAALPLLAGALWASGRESAGPDAHKDISRASWAGAWDWHETLSPHFQVSHEMAWMPGGFTMSLERMHGRLRMDLAMFSPWMSKERIKLYLYKDSKSYQAGEFKPPPWSNGIALYEKKTVAVPDQADRRKLLAVISHETTHLLFESYWGEAGRIPPAWLNEGLAMMEEAESPEHPEGSEWYRAMVYVLGKKTLPMRDFVKVAPTLDLKDDRKAVEAWYVQAYSAVYFLFRARSKLQFKSFCGMLRDGKDLRESLWLAYRYRSLEKFEEAWKAWLRDPAHSKRVESARVSARAQPPEEAAQEPVGAIKGFKPLRR